MKYILIFLVISTFCFSQKISFIYETKYKLNLEKPDDFYSDNMILDLKNNISSFRESQDKKSDSIKLNNGNARFKIGVENQFYVKKNLTQKIIGKYKSQKAEANYGGRSWITWLTTELPFGDGPYIFNGLPGLIVSVQDSHNEYSFNLIEVKKSGNIFDTRKKTINIDWKKYETLVKAYFNDPYDVMSKVGMTVTFTDPNGKIMDISIKSKKMQNNI